MQEAPAPTSFIQAQGFEVLRFGPHEAEIALSPRPDHLNTWGVLHGGMAMSLLDVAMAHAARSPQSADEAVADPRGVVTIEMKTSFMRPGEGRVTAVACTKPAPWRFAKASCSATRVNSLRTPLGHSSSCALCPPADVMCDGIASPANRRKTQLQLPAFALT